MKILRNKITVFSIGDLEQSHKELAAWAINDHLDMLSNFLDDAMNTKNSLSKELKDGFYTLNFEEPTGATMVKENFSILFEINMFDLLPERFAIVTPIIKSLKFNKE